MNARSNVNGVELLRYIPQTYLEKVCTETEPGQQSEFQIELRKVIFSHISEADRLGKETLDQLIQYKTEELKGQIDNARREIARVNVELVRLEDKGTPQHIAQLEAKLRLKQQELKAHADNQPGKVEPPTNVSPEQQAATEAVATKLAAERTELARLDAIISQQTNRQKTLTEKIAIARKTEGKLDNFEAEFARLERETKPDLEKLGLEFGSVITLTLNKNVLTQARDTLVNEKVVVDSDLAPETTTGVVAQRTACLGRIAALQDQLDAPNKRYQQYIESLRRWQEGAQAIEGDAEKPDTLKWYEAQLTYIKTELPKDIEQQRLQRRQIAEEIHKSIGAIRDVYSELFSAVQDLISSSVVIKEGFKLTFESSIIERTFQTDFFDRYISQGNVGSFYGKERGGTILEELRADYDFNNAADAISFVGRVTEHLESDARNPQKLGTGIASQLRKNVDVKALYDFLWSFGYLEPEYSLKLDGKDLSHLSPGERGTLLLVFYLLVDKSNKPIIVDQPEENLDSQTVFRLLIPVIKDVKKRRQIIMVTHSPNIAEVCDAEQIIHAHIDRSAANKAVYTMGGIESPDINRYLVDVLEGTRPAFDNREAKCLCRVSRA